MSWDVAIFRFSQRYTSMDELPADGGRLPLGRQEEIHRAVLEVFPGTDWRDPEWGSWDSGSDSIEFSVGDGDPPDGIMLHVRAGDAVVGGIIQLCVANGWQALDLSTGEFLDSSENPERGLRLWQAYRDRVLGRT